MGNEKVEYWAYRSETHIFKVTQGIGGKTGKWFALIHTPGKPGAHRVMSKLLPPRETREEAQADLDGYAAKVLLDPCCRVCGCTEHDCSGCVEKTGEPCLWVEPGLCSACAEGF